MALNHTRTISRVFQSRLGALSVNSHNNNQLNHTTKRHDSGGDGRGSTPYRPWPLSKYMWPKAAEFWIPRYPTTSAASDEYEKEEIYLHEIEERLRKYDKKYSDSDKIKKLYNEFGWDAIDDRATVTYGGGLSSIDGELQYGPGKKLDPSHYVTPEWCNVNRKAIPPVQFMTAEQVRRSRGSLASHRELPPEQPSIWKYWNVYAAFGTFTSLMICKEWFVVGGHDMFEGILLWGIMGTAASVLSDWMAWWHTLVMQERYDRTYFVLDTATKKLNSKLEVYNSKPNEKILIVQMQKFREILAEKVLSKTLLNRMGRVVETTIKQMDDKINEEAVTKKEADTLWRREALNSTLQYFDNDSVRDDFMKNALNEFCKENAAKLSNEARTINLDTPIFIDQYQSNYQNAKKEFLSDQRAKGTLNHVFRDANERESEHMTSDQRSSEYDRRIAEWVQGRNAVNAPTPSFS